MLLVGFEQDEEKYSILLMLMISVSLAGCLSNDTDPVVETKEITDSDSDGVPDSIDNCPDLFNPEQFTDLLVMNAQKMNCVLK